MPIFKRKNQVLRSRFAILGLLPLFFVMVSLACGPSAVNYNTLPSAVPAELQDSAEQQESTKISPEDQPITQEETPTHTAEVDSSVGEESPTAVVPVEASDVILVGIPSLALGQAAKSIQDQGAYSVSVNPDDYSNARLVLLTVNAPDGLMPPLLAEIEGHKGQKMARVAVLLIGVDEQDDPEILELVKLEILEVVPRYFAAEPSWRLDFLQMPDPNLLSLIEALLILPEMDIQITTPNP